MSLESAGVMYSATGAGATKDTAGPGTTYSTTGRRCWCDVLHNWRKGNAGIHSVRSGVAALYSSTFASSVPNWCWPHVRNDKCLAQARCTLAPARWAQPQVSVPVPPWSSSQMELTPSVPSSCAQRPPGTCSCRLRPRRHVSPRRQQLGNNASAWRKRFGADDEDEVAWWSNHLVFTADGVDAVSSFAMPQTTGTLYVPPTTRHTKNKYLRMSTSPIKLLQNEVTLESAGRTLGRATLPRDRSV